MNTSTAIADTASALVLTRVFDAPPATVFRLWSDPARVKEWWHPKDFTTPLFEMDFREGGAYRFSIRPQSGRETAGEATADRDISAHGIYQEIDAPNRLVMTFQWDSGESAHRPTIITVTFGAHGDGKTLLTFRQEPFASEEKRDRHGQGWSQFLDAFGLALAGARP